jgi:4-amino-4-deoxy-L-arabinose transferase-like glycosyltransferase
MRLWVDDQGVSTPGELLSRPAVAFLGREENWSRAGLGLVIAIATALRFANLSVLGYVNHYYTAAITAMLQSWHNFFFLAAEPGGAVSVDKPPLGLWIQAISARIFGVNTFGLLLPELLAGVASVALLYHLVRRRFGPLAGLLAALTLAITPVAVATDRNNTIDSLLILSLLLAAWAFIRATESGKLSDLLLGALCVGLGFNIKMLQALLPLPALYALYLFGSGERISRKIAKLLLASALVAIVSLSWVAIVELTPAAQRPYIGSSGDNHETSLIVGYNGMQRLLGMGGLNRLVRPVVAVVQAPGAGRIAPGGTAPVFPAGGPAQNRGGGPGAFPASRRVPSFQVGGAAAGISQTGQPGPWRLFLPPLTKEASWLLPMALLAAILLLVAPRKPSEPDVPVASGARTSKRRLSVGANGQALLLWGGWLLTAGAFFAVANFFHEYYLDMVSAPIAALAGIGFALLWRTGRRRWWLGLIGTLAGSIATLLLQFQTVRMFVAQPVWATVPAGLAAIGLAILFAGRNRDLLARAGFACIAASLLITPAIWAVQTNRNPSVNQSLPSAYNGATTAPDALLGLNIDQELVDFLNAGTANNRYLVAVPSSMQGSDYVIATKRPVLYLGGFMGQDQVVTSSELTKLIADGELRYIYTSQQRGDPRRPGVASGPGNGLPATCSPVSGFDTSTRNMGAPGGTSRSDNGAGLGMGGLQISLYDCAAPKQRSQSVAGS